MFFVGLGLVVHILRTATPYGSRKQLLGAHDDVLTSYQPFLKYYPGFRHWEPTSSCVFNDDIVGFLSYPLCLVQSLGGERVDRNNSSACQ